MMKIINFKKQNHETFKAKFDIQFSIGTVFGFKLVCTKGKTFISFPSTEYQLNGEKKYKMHYYPPEEKTHDFQKKVLELLRPFIEENAHVEENEDSFF